MKTIIKFILSFICYLLLIPCLLGLTVSLIWYVLSAFQTTFIGEWLLTILTEQEIFITTICLLGLTILFKLFGRLFRVINNSKAVNFYTHIVTWLLAIVLCVEALFTFFISNTLSTTAFNLTLFRKIALGAGVFIMLLYGMFHKKLGKLVDRKLQAYDTAKELNANGRSSVVWVNILKTIDFIFPEVILLLMLCFAFNFEVSLYFIVILSSFIIPIVGNMICDKRVKKEAIKREQEKTDAQINATAEAVVDLISQRGGNP